MIKVLKLKTLRTVVLTAVGIIATSMSYAGTDAPAAATPPPPKSNISGDLGVAIVSEYLSRGLVLENQGAIVQPYLDIYYKMYEGTGFINSASLQLGFWSSVNSHLQPVIGSANTTPHWYEIDWTPTISVTFAKNFTLSLAYFEFDSPSSMFETARSINTSLSYNDSDLLGAYALHPHFTVLAELPAPGAAGLGKGGWYYETGVAPSYTFAPKSTYPVTLTVPVTAGFGSSNFYGSSNFGYISTGITASVPLAFIPSSFGSWTATAGYSYYYLANTVADATATGHNNQSSFSGAIGMTF